MSSCAKAPVAVFSHESLPVKSLHAPHERNAYTFVAGSTAVVFRLLRRLEQNGDIHKVPRMSSCRRLLSLCFKLLGRLPLSLNCEWTCLVCPQCHPQARVKVLWVGSSVWGRWLWTTAAVWWGGRQWCYFAGGGGPFSIQHGCAPVG